MKSNQTLIAVSPRPEPRQMTIQEASPEAARLQVFNDQLARLCDQKDLKIKELQLEVKNLKIRIHELELMQFAHAA